MEIHYYDCLFLPDSLTSMAAIDLVGSNTSRCGHMTDAALVYLALVYAALRKSGHTQIRPYIKWIFRP